MKNKQLSKYVVYVPKKNLTIQKVNRPFDNWRLLLIPVLFILLVLSSSLGNSFYFPMLFGFVISIVVTIKNNINATFFKYIEFTPRRFSAKNHIENRDGDFSYFLKSPIYLDVIVKQKNDRLNITFEQYGKKIGSTKIPAEELTYLLDNLNDLLGLKIQDSRSTSNNDDVLYLRPKDDDNLIPSYLKITDDATRLIVNPTSTTQSFIVNHHRKIIRTAKGKIHATDDIKSIIIIIKQQRIKINAILSINQKSILIIQFESKSYDTNIIKKDMEAFVDLLKTKAVLQHIQFDIEILF